MFGPRKNTHKQKRTQASNKHVMLQGPPEPTTGAAAERRQRKRRSEAAGRTVPKVIVLRILIGRAPARPDGGWCFIVLLLVGRVRDPKPNILNNTEPNVRNQALAVSPLPVDMS
jgi:hypothetical protein